jgi:hypothetical protein
MKIVPVLIALTTVLLSCNGSSDTNKTESQAEEIKKPSFFPVTAYFKGQLSEFEKSGINPLKYTTIKGHTDSAWLKIDEVKNAVKEFLYPEIDSINLVSLFTERSFLDQSLDAVTFTYEAAGKLPDTMTLRQWNVYLSPETGKVKKIYMLKEPAEGRTLQLTWQSGEWCKIVSIITDQKGNSSVEKEEKITWVF